MIIKTIGKTELRPDTLVEHIRARRAEIELVLKEREKALEIAPEGKLRINKIGNSLQYHHRMDHSDTEGVYLKRSQDSLAAALAQKNYDRNLVSELRAEIRALTRVIDQYRPERINEIFFSLHNNYKELVNPVILPDDDYVKRWMSVEYETRNFEVNAPEYYTSKGERVRSKSELIIADALSRFKIPYRYEYPIRISGIGIVHPDFTCLNVQKRKEYIWEHFGMMSDSNYLGNALNKIEKYTQDGYCPCDNILMSFETISSPLSSRVIEHYIRKFLL